MSVAEDRGKSLESVLASAREGCRNTLADYRAGFLDDAELRLLLAGAGLGRLRQVVDELAHEAEGPRGDRR